MGCLTALCALAGATILPVVVLVIEIVVTNLDPDCGAPGDAGGCAMGVAANTIMAAPLGLAAGLIAAFVIGLRRRRRRAGGEGG
ncbi:MAG TPA: hypothetical protein VEC58_03555 [Roseiarcus sp.]|nr:hypothetical protein [Roseiarcus sp.]